MSYEETTMSERRDSIFYSTPGKNLPAFLENACVEALRLILEIDFFLEVNLMKEDLLQHLMFYDSRLCLIY